MCMTYKDHIKHTNCSQKIQSYYGIVLLQLNVPSERYLVKEKSSFLLAVLSNPQPARLAGIQAFLTILRKKHINA
jgi:hypothetical protein